MNYENLIVEVNEPKIKKVYKVISATFVDDPKRSFPSDDARYEFIRQLIGKKYEIEITKNNHAYCYLKDTSGRVFNSEGKPEGFVTQMLTNATIRKDKFLTIETKDYNYLFILEEFVKTETKL